MAIVEPAIKKSSPPKLPAIQMLRALAAALVVFHHFSGVVAGHNKHRSWFVSSRLAQVGAAGVDIFFVISGFIMFYTTTQKGGMSDAKTFLFKRALRIYPLYWFWASFLLLLASSKLLPIHTHGLDFIVSSYLLIPTFNGRNFHPFLDQGWTLSFEMLFYCVFAVWLWTGRWRSILVFLGALFGVLSLISVFLPTGSGIKYLLSNTLIIEFLFGVGLAKLYLRRHHETGGKPIPNWIPVAVTTLGFGLLFSSIFVHADKGSLIESSWRFFFWGIPSALIVSGFATWNQKFTHPVLVYLGDASYTTYLVHVFLLGAFRLILERFSALRGLPVDLEMLAAVALTILLTLPAYQWIERPLTALSSLAAPNRARASWLSNKKQLVSP